MISSSSSIHSYDSRNNRKTNTGSGIVWWNVLSRLSWFYKLSIRSYSYFRMHIVCLCIWRHLHFREANAAYIEEDYNKLYWWDELKIARSSKLKTPKHTCLLFISFCTIFPVKMDNNLYAQENTFGHKTLLKDVVFSKILFRLYKQRN